MTEENQGAAVTRGLNVRAGREPVSAPAVRSAAILLGCALLALATLAGREAWRVVADSPTSSWTQPAIDVMSSAGVRGWMVWAGIGATLVGVLCLWMAFAPRSKRHLALGTPLSAWTRPVDVARRCSAVARQVPGVQAARSQARRGAVRVIVNGDVDDQALIERVAQALVSELSALRKPLVVRVTAERIEEVDASV